MQSELPIDVLWDDADAGGRTTAVPEFDVARFARDAAETTQTIPARELRRLIHESLPPLDDPMGTSGDRDADFVAEDSLLAEEVTYEQVLGLDHRLVVPRVPPANDWKESATARVYLVADGQSSISSVVAKSGLPRAEALAALCDLYRRGVVELVEP